MTYAHRVAAIAVALIGACSKNPASIEAVRRAPESGTPTQPFAEAPVIRIDGSSTVYPITEAAAEEFQRQSPIKVTIGVSGTGGGFKKFCGGEVAIAGASRPIRLTEERACKAAKIDFVELPIAYDGLAVVVHHDNAWASAITVSELRKIWEPGAQQKILNWSQVRPGWPERPLHLYAPGVDSGTYDYFTKAIVGSEHQSRGDYTASEDDNVLVQGVSRDEGGLAFFGFAYFQENTDKLKLLAIDDENPDNGDGPILPNAETVGRGTYQPLSRPIFLYVAKSALQRQEVAAFIEFYLSHITMLVQETHYIALPPKAYELAHRRFMAGTTGSLFAGKGSEVGVTVEALLAHD